MKISINCPICSEKGYITLSDDKIKHLSRGLLAVNIEKKIICSHTFIAYIDNNSLVRDYFTADFHIDLPEIISFDEIERQKILKSELIDIFLIKINLQATLLTHVIKSIFFKKKVAIILEELRYDSHLKDEILNFFKYITEDSFNADISIISKVEYQKKWKKYKEFIVFEGNKIRRNNSNFFNRKKLKIERQIINKFLSEYDSNYSLIILKNEIQKIYNLAKEIAEFLNSYREKEGITIKLISDYLAKCHNIILHKVQMDFLLEIANVFFEVDIPKNPYAADFLEFI